MARLYMDKGRDQDAVLILQQLVEDDGSSEVGLVGRLRLAKVLLYQDKADEVVTLLEDHLDNAFAARYNEVLGDAYAALGSIAKADAAYNAALADVAASRTIDSNLIQLKINDLPAIDETAGVTSAVDEVAADVVDEGAAESIEETAESAPEDVADEMAAAEETSAGSPAVDGDETPQ